MARGGGRHALTAIVGLEERVTQLLWMKGQPIESPPHIMSTTLSNHNILRGALSDVVSPRSDIDSPIAPSHNTRTPHTLIDPHLWVDQYEPLRRVVHDEGILDRCLALGQLGVTPMLQERYIAQGVLTRVIWGGFENEDSTS